MEFLVRAVVSEPVRRQGWAGVRGRGRIGGVLGLPTGLSVGRASLLKGGCGERRGCCRAGGTETLSNLHRGGGTVLGGRQIHPPSTQ